MSTVYIPMGLWGCGKTTWSKQFVKDHRNTKIVCADGFRLMMNGEYEYIVELDDIIDRCMIATANELLSAGYDVIVDVCNLTSERRLTWINGIKADNYVGVVFPHKDKQWHLSNRGKNIHRFESDEIWDKMFDKQIAAFEPIDENMFTSLMRVAEW